MTTLPIAKLAPPVATAPKGVVAEALVTEDFLLTLAQLLQGNAAIAAPARPQPVTSSEPKLTAEDKAPETALLAVCNMPIPVMPIGMNVAAAAVSTSPVSELHSAAAGVGDSNELLQALERELEEALELSELPSDSAVDEAHGTFRSDQAAFTTLAPMARPNSLHAHAQLDAPVGTARWTDDLGAKLIMMTDHSQHSASLKLAPEHLGPLEVRISIREDQASVWFGAAHADTRAAIEQALPRLREMFAAQGLVLADSGVFREAPQGQSQGSSAEAPSLGGEKEVELEGNVTRMSIGLIDAYA